MPTDMDLKFVKLMESIVRERTQHAEMELAKAKHHNEIMGLPPKKENWEAQDNAETKMMEHLTNVLTIMQENEVILHGIGVFQDGLIYRELKKVKAK